MSEKVTKRYDRDFKLGTVKMVLDEGRPVAQVAEDLGVTAQTINNWIRAFKGAGNAKVFPGSGNPAISEQEAELRKLREENRILRMERDLLKKTLPLFMEARK